MEFEIHHSNGGTVHLFQVGGHGGKLAVSARALDATEERR